MKKAGLFAWIFTATLFSVSPLTSLPAKAEGGCPSGMVPVGGGYCRNIVCVDNMWDTNTEPVMKKYGLTCPAGRARGAIADFEKKNGREYDQNVNRWAGGIWGNMMVPMRK